MGDLALARIDSRLIHGQVCTQWINRTGANRVIIIDDDITADPFLFQIFMLATPVGIKLDIYSTKDAGDKWKENKFDEPSPIIVLYKNVPMVYRAYHAGCKFESLQVGGIGGGHGRTNVVGPIALDKEDGKMLNEMANNGMRIYFQPVPDSAVVDWSDVKKKFYKDLP